MSEQSRELMRKITAEIWDEGKLDRIDHYIAVDLIDHIEDPTLVAVGRERYRETAVKMRTAFSNFRNPLDLIVAENDVAVSYGRNVGTNTGEFMGMRPTGKAIDVVSVGMLRFKDGQAIERWGFSDSVTMMQQLAGSSDRAQLPIGSYIRRFRSWDVEGGRKPSRSSRAIRARLFRRDTAGWGLCHRCCFGLRFRRLASTCRVPSTKRFSRSRRTRRCRRASISTVAT
jgi:predicted ester cyclase